MKRNAVAWTEAPEREPGRAGRSRKKGDKVRLWELFETKWAEFTKETIKIHGKDTTVEILSEDLLWGKGLYQKLRFVLVREGESRFILFIRICPSSQLTSSAFTSFVSAWKTLSGNSNSKSALSPTISGASPCRA